MTKKDLKVLFSIFILALLVRFIFFPSNIYFGFDQARDAYESQSIYLKGNIKIIGPSTAAENLFHGPLYWYLIGPFYLLGSGNPVFPAAFLIVLNALNIFVLYYFGKLLVNKKFALIASLLYAVSFEQTQYALYFGNPAPAVLTITLFYLALSAFLFKKKWWGLPLSLFFLGLSIQFEFFLIYLGIILVLLLTIFIKTVKLDLKTILASGTMFLLSTSTFILSELKFQFRTTKTLFAIFTKTAPSSPYQKVFFEYFRRLVLQIHDNIFGLTNTKIEGAILVAILLMSVYWIAKRKKQSKLLVVFLVWFLSTIILTKFGNPTLYYTNIGVSVGLIMLTTFFLCKLPRKVVLLILAVIIAGNLSRVYKENKNGITNDIYVQEGMLLGKELKVIDYIYLNSNQKFIVVSALTMPLNINTTWAYLFNWYGKATYQKVPFWSGDVAEGYPGSLPAWVNQSEDFNYFSIIEPTRGIRQAFVNNFTASQESIGPAVNSFTQGNAWYNQIIVQKRK